MTKRSKCLFLALIMLFLLISIKACSNGEQKEEGLNKEQENAEQYPITPLFKDVFEQYYTEIGKSKFEEDQTKFKSLTNYSIEVTTPDNDQIGRIKISDASGDYAALLYYPLNGVETLSMVTYNRNGYEISVSNELHASSTLKYTTYNIDDAEKNKAVLNIDELKKFMFVEIGEGKSNTSEKIDVYLNINEVKTDDGKVYFEIETNLPTETSLLVSVSGEGYNGSSNVTVTNNKATTDTFSNKGNALNSGEYTVEVTMAIPSIQSNAVRDIIGNTGENMTGDLVTKSLTGDSYLIEKRIKIVL